MKLSMTISDGSGEPESKAPAEGAAKAASPLGADQEQTKKAKKGGFPLKLLLLAAAGGAVAVVKGMRR